MISTKSPVFIANIVLLAGVLSACSATVPADEAASSQSADLRVDDSLELGPPDPHRRHPPPRVCQDVNPSCTSVEREPDLTNPIEQTLTELCHSKPIDWHEWNSESDHAYDTFFQCPSSQALSDYMATLSWGVAHTSADVCGVCIPFARRGHVYVVTNRRELIPTCTGAGCQVPADYPVSRW
jgi:hypothetical protein